MLLAGSMAERTKLSSISPPLVKTLLPRKSTRLRSWLCSNSAVGAGVDCSGWSLPPEWDLL